MLIVNKPRGQITTGIIVFSLSLIVLLFFILLELPLKYSFVLILSSIIFFVSFINTNTALMVLIFSMLFSPEFKLGGIAGREIVLRLDDIFLFIISLGWLARMAVNKELGLLKTTPLNKPIILYILICLISTLWGVLRGYAKIQVSVFYLLKYFEYFLLFFMVTNNLKSYKQIRIFVFSIIFVALLVSIYAFLSHLKGVARVSAPFEGVSGEANTLGGYLILIIVLVSALLLHLPAINTRLFMLSVLIFALPVLVFTLSRGSWLGFIPAFITLIILVRKGRVVLLLASLLVIIFSRAIFPSYFFERIRFTFIPGKEYRIMGRRVALEESAVARINVFKYAFQKWTKEPILGYGVGSSAPIIDCQAARIILEVGLSGLLIFLWLIFKLFTNAFWNMARLRDDNFAQGLISGFLAGLVGLIVHSLFAETFIIIRIMEPFWFLAAIVIVLPEFQREHLT